MEAVVQATLDLIAMDQAPTDRLALADKVYMVSQTPNVQLNATLPAQDSSSSINTTTARAEVTADPLYTTIAHNSNTSPTALMSGYNHIPGRSTSHEFFSNVSERCTRTTRSPRYI